MDYDSSEKNRNGEKEKEDTKIKSDKIIDNPIILQYISNSTDFKLIMLLTVYQELSLTELNRKSGISKATLSRHLKKMLSDDIVILSKEVLVRGDRKAQYFSLSRSIYSLLPSISEKDLKSLDNSQKNRIYKITRAITNSSVDFSVESIVAFKHFLNSLDDKMGGKLETFFNNPDFYLTFNFLSKEQYNRYIELLKEFNLKLVQSLSEIEKKHPNANKSYLLCNYLIPITTIFDDEVDWSKYKDQKIK